MPPFDTMAAGNDTDSMRVLIAGAGGFVGRSLVPELIDRGFAVRCLVRDPDSESSRALGQMGAELRRGDVTDPASLDGIAEGIDVAYYMVHLMAGDQDALAARERGSAGAFARECRRAGVKRMVYLGGLGDAGASEHLGSRHGTSEALRSEGPPLTYFRAGMVVGAGSESFVLLRSLIERLPGNVILAPEWIHNRTQPIALEDVVHYLVQAATVDEAEGREFQIGGPDVMTYAEMLDEMSKALGGGPLRKIGADSMSAKAAGRGAAAVTEGNPRIAELITAGLETDTVVEDDAALEVFHVELDPLPIALAKAIEDDAQASEDAAAARGG
jgi:uncharacterized protein YbjT (DUF2867 family)